MGLFDSIRRVVGGGDTGGEADAATDEDPPELVDTRDLDADDLRSRAEDVAGEVGQLDFSLASLEQFDAAIEAGYDDELHTSDTPGTYDRDVVRFGSYLGEVIVRVYGGEWTDDDGWGVALTGPDDTVTVSVFEVATRSIETEPVFAAVTDRAAVEVGLDPSEVDAEAPHLDWEPREETDTADETAESDSEATEAGDEEPVAADAVEADEATPDTADEAGGDSEAGAADDVATDQAADTDDATAEAGAETDAITDDTPVETATETDESEGGTVERRRPDGEAGRGSGAASDDDADQPSATATDEDDDPSVATATADESDEDSDSGFEFGSEMETPSVDDESEVVDNDEPATEDDGETDAATDDTTESPSAPEAESSTAPDAEQMDQSADTTRTEAGESDYTNPFEAVAETDEDDDEDVSSLVDEAEPERPVDEAEPERLVDEAEPERPVDEAATDDGGEGDSATDDAQSDEGPADDEPSGDGSLLGDDDATVGASPDAAADESTEGADGKATEEPADPTPDPTEGDGLRAEYAEEAEGFVSFWSEHDLDYSPESLERLDGLVAAEWDDQRFDDATFGSEETFDDRAFTSVAMELGSYFGEVLVRELGAEWSDQTATDGVIVDGPEGPLAIPVFRVAGTSLKQQPVFARSYQSLLEDIDG